MAVASNTVNISTVVGARESLADKRYMIEPTATPVLTAMGGMGKAKAFYEEWLPVSLNSANKDNAAIDGDDAPANSTPSSATRVGNRIQLSFKIASVAEGQNQVSVAGDQNKMKTELVDKAIELRRDMEQAVLSNNPSVAMTSSAAGKSAGFQAWLTSNVSRGASGANGGFSGGIVAAATNGTNRVLTYALVTGVMQTRFTASGNARTSLMAVMPPSVKTTYWSTFTGLSINRVENQNSKLGATVQQSIDIILTDFGQLQAIPHAYAFATGQKCVVIVDPSNAEVLSFSGINQEKLAKSGFADRQKLDVYWTLKVNNEKAHGIVTDIT